MDWQDGLKDFQQLYKSLKFSKILVQTKIMILYRHMGGESGYQGKGGDCFYCGFASGIKIGVTAFGAEKDGMKYPLANVEKPGYKNCI